MERSLQDPLPGTGRRRRKVRKDKMQLENKILDSFCSESYICCCLDDSLVKCPFTHKYLAGNMGRCMYPVDDIG